MILDIPSIDRSQSAGRQLYGALRERILTAAARPGEALSETKVAEQLGVSRTPVREVFQRLAEEGFLRIVPQVGTFVAPINLAAVHDSQFVRETLECRAVALAAKRAGAPELRTLQQHLKTQGRLIARNDHLGFFKSDEAMHRTLMGMAGHPTAWDLIASAKTQLDRVRYLSLESADWLDVIYGQHRQIIAHVADGDAVRAERAMRDHLRSAFAAIERIAQSNQDFFDTRPASADNRPGRHSKRRKTS